MAKNPSIVQVVENLIAPVADELGYFIWDIEFVKEGGKRILRVTIDNEEGITIEDCEKLHRAIDPVLDEADPIEEAYYLEVSSPGIERDLKNDMHISACEGWDVEVRLYAPVDNAKVFRGKLMEIGENGEIRIDASGTVREFPRSAVAKVQTYFEF
jgi:ribosome maturation factor RimP